MNSGQFAFDITSNNINEIIKKTLKTPLLLLCWAEQVQESAGFKQFLINFVNKFEGRILLGLINVEVEQQLAMYLQISGIPEIKLIVKGNVADELQGVVTEQQLLEFLKKYVKLELPEQKTAFDDIKNKIVNFDFEGVDNALGELAKKDKNNDKILIELVKYYLLTGSFEKAEETAQNIADSEIKFLMDALDFWKLRDSALNIKQSADSDYDEKLAAALNTIIVEHNFNAAMDILLELVAKNKNYKEQIARKALVSIFTILGQNKTVEIYRNKLYNLIF